MNFCTQCGQKLEEGQDKCNNCGNIVNKKFQSDDAKTQLLNETDNNKAPFDESNTLKKDDVNQLNHQKSLFNIGKISKKAKIILLTAMAIFIVLSGFVFTSYTKAEKVKEQLNLGNKYLEEGNYEEAILALNKVIEVDSKNTDARVQLGKAYTMTGKTDKAENVLKEAIAIDSKKSAAYSELANTYISDSKIKEAKEILENGYKKTADENLKKLLNEINYTSAGNIVNGGFVTEDDEWIYFTTLSKSIYKTPKKDKNKEFKVADLNSKVQNLNLQGGWLYFTVDEKVTRMKTDGTELSVLSEDAQKSYSCLTLSNDRLYYLNKSSNIISINKDGKDLKLISSDKCQCINVVDSWIYYVNLSDNKKYNLSNIWEDAAGKIYKIDINGSNKTKLTDEGTHYISVYKNWIYYANFDDGVDCDRGGNSKYTGKLYKISIEGKEKRKIVDKHCTDINATNKGVYYNNEDEWTLDKVIDDKDIKVVNIGSILSTANIADNDIFYIQNDSSQNKYDYKYYTDNQWLKVYRQSVKENDVIEVEPISVVVKATNKPQIATGGGMAPDNELWVKYSNGKEELLVASNYNADIKKQIAGVSEPQFTKDRKKVYFMCQAFAVSRSIHVIDIKSRSEHFVCDGNYLKVIQDGEYAGKLIVNKHKYYEYGGSYNNYYIVDDQGTEIKDLGYKQDVLNQY